MRENPDSDKEQMALRKVITQGWLSVISQVPEMCDFRDTMTVQEGIVYKGGQVVIPPSGCPVYSEECSRCGILAWHG